MEARAGRSPLNPLLVAAAVAIIVFCGAGVAAIMGWIPTSIGGGSAPSTSPVASANAPAGSARPRASEVKIRSASEPGHRASDAKPVAAAKCTDCGVVESVREVEKTGQATGLGAVGGAVAGGVLGNQVGQGTGRDVMTVVGAVAGGVAGNQIEKKVRSTKVYEITVRMESGDARVITEPTLPSWRQGDKVRFIDGRIQPNNA